MNSFDLDEILKLFGRQIHICEIIPTNISVPKRLEIKGNLHPKIAKDILKDYIPIKDEWEYRQDKRIKRMKITRRYIF